MIFKQLITVTTISIMSQSIPLGIKRDTFVKIWSELKNSIWNGKVIDFVVI